MSLELTISECDPNVGVGQVWQQLYDHDTKASPFLSIQWVNTWMKVYCAPYKIQQCLWSENKKPVAICLLVSRRGRWGRFNVRQVGINTCLDFPEGSVVIEYNDIVCLPDYRRLVQASLGSLLKLEPHDEFNLSGLAPDSLLTDYTPPNSLRDYDWKSQDAPFLDMTNVADSTKLIELFSSNTRSQLRRAQRSVSATHEPVVTSAKTVEQALDLLENLFEFHKQRWQNSGKPSSLESVHLKEFHRKFVRAAFHTGQIGLYEIIQNGVCLGYIYGFLRLRRFYFYQSGFNYQAAPNAKPGLVAHYSVMQHLFNQGFLHYDFLAGQSQYKLSLSNAKHTLSWKTFRQNSIKMLTLVTLAKAKRKIRRT
jgi:hypothetical protein